MSTFKLKPRHSLYRKKLFTTLYINIEHHTLKIDENKQQQQQRYTCIKVKKQNKQKNKKYEFLFHLQYWFIDIHKTNTKNQIVTNYLPLKEDYLPLKKG